MDPPSVCKEQHQSLESDDGRHHQPAGIELSRDDQEVLSSPHESADDSTSSSADDGDGEAELPTTAAGLPSGSLDNDRRRNKQQSNGCQQERSEQSAEEEEEGAGIAGESSATMPSLTYLGVMVEKGEDLSYVERKDQEKSDDAVGEAAATNTVAPYDSQSDNKDKQEEPGEVKSKKSHAQSTGESTEVVIPPRRKEAEARSGLSPTRISRKERIRQRSNSRGRSEKKPREEASSESEEKEIKINTSPNSTAQSPSQASNNQGSAHPPSRINRRKLMGRSQSLSGKAHKKQAQQVPPPRQASFDNRKSERRLSALYQRNLDDEDNGEEEKDGLDDDTLMQIIQSHGLREEGREAGIARGQSLQNNYDLDQSIHSILFQDEEKEEEKDDMGKSKAMEASFSSRGRQMEDGHDSTVRPGAYSKSPGRTFERNRSFERNRYQREVSEHYLASSPFQQSFSNINDMLKQRQEETHSSKARSAAKLEERENKENAKEATQKTEDRNNDDDGKPPATAATKAQPQTKQEQALEVPHFKPQNTRERARLEDTPEMSVSQAALASTLNSNVRPRNSLRDSLGVARMPSLSERSSDEKSMYRRTSTTSTNRTSFTFTNGILRNMSEEQLQQAHRRASRASIRRVPTISDIADQTVANFVRSCTTSAEGLPIAARVVPSEEDLEDLIRSRLESELQTHLHRELTSFREQLLREVGNSFIVPADDTPVSAGLPVAPLAEVQVTGDALADSEGEQPSSDSRCFTQSIRQSLQQQFLSLENELENTFSLRSHASAFPAIATISECSDVVYAASVDDMEGGLSQQRCQAEKVETVEELRSQLNQALSSLYLMKQQQKRWKRGRLWRSGQRRFDSITNEGDHLVRVHNRRGGTIFEKRPNAFSFSSRSGFMTALLVMFLLGALVGAGSAILAVGSA
jgi:hypothetical protein